MQDTRWYVYQYLLALVVANNIVGLFLTFSLEAKLNQTTARHYPIAGRLCIKPGPGKQVLKYALYKNGNLIIIIINYKLQ